MLIILKKVALVDGIVNDFTDVGTSNSNISMDPIVDTLGNLLLKGVGGSLCLAADFDLLLHRQDS